MRLERLLDNLALELDAFAACRVAPGWRLRLPALDWVTFHYVVRGQGEVRGQTPDPMPVSAGALVVVPPHLVHGIQCGPAPHAEEAVGGSESAPIAFPTHSAGPEAEGELLVVCGRVHVLYGGGVGVFDRLRDVLVLDFADESKMKPLFEALLAEVHAQRPGSRAMTTALMNESIVHVFRRLCADADCRIPWLEALEDADLRPAVDRMLDRPEQPYTVESLARLCFMSRSSFARRFQQRFAQPPMEFLRGIRLRRAARLLRIEPPLSVSTIARRVGFESRSQFSRTFKDFFEHSPTEFRARARES